VEKISLKLPICDFCTHYINGQGKMCCEAFPEGIPMERILLEDDGKECANGIKYEEENAGG